MRRTPAPAERAGSLKKLKSPPRSRFRLRGNASTLMQSSVKSLRNLKRQRGSDSKVAKASCL